MRSIGAPPVGSIARSSHDHHRRRSRINIAVGSNTEYLHTHCAYPSAPGAFFTMASRAAMLLDPRSYTRHLQGNAGTVLLYPVHPSPLLLPATFSHSPPDEPRNHRLAHVDGRP